MTDDKNTTEPSPTLQYERTENFISVYTNNVFFQPSAWDLQIIFGQLDQTSGKDIVKQQVAVTIPWAQAKLALYYLRLQVEAMEIQSGKIPIRKDLIPPEPPPLTSEQESIPDSKKILELIQKIREEFIASL
jgi:hypothetical protein